MNKKAHPLGLVPAEAQQVDLPSLNRASWLSLFLLSAATLAFEINLTRLFSVTQFYHFAFMIVSIALLGFGASGTILALFPRVGQRDLQSSLSLLSLAIALSMVGAYLLTNWLPFDSFSLAVDQRQVWILVLHYLALTTPFFFSGMAVALLLSAWPASVGQTYAVNLSGSAVGCLVALAAPSWLGGEGTVVLSSGMAALAAIFPVSRRLITAPKAAALLLLLFSLTDLSLRIGGSSSFSWLELRISPYKSLSYALQYPGSQVIYQRWNSVSRVELVRSPGIRSLPGLSFRYLQSPPPQDGLLVDGDELSPVVLQGADPDFASYLPAAAAFQLRPGAETLVLEPRGGLDVVTALSLGSRQVTAVEVNPLIVEAASHVYSDQRIRVVVESDRSYMRRAGQTFDLVVLSLASSYHPVSSGAYSLAEDYRYTVEAFQDALRLLAPDGLLVVTRWLQDPPSESLRAFALAVTALEAQGMDPAGQIVAFRGYQTGTLLVSKVPFAPGELAVIRDFLQSRGFDLTYAPDVRPEETNRFSILRESTYYQAFTALLSAPSRDSFYETYPFDVSPPTDDHPFFGHYFKWSQAGQVLAELGKTWQPFGGAGYFVILALLLLAILMSSILILLPVALKRPAGGINMQELGDPLMYFGMIGLAFLLVEIPLIQRFILYLGHPAYALTAVLFSILIFSGIGSRMSGRIPLKSALLLLILLVLSTPLLLPVLFDLTLGLAFPLRLGLTVAALAPLGFLMGIPFPGGIQWMLSSLQSTSPAKALGEDENEVPRIAWIWAVNGAASVISAVLAALLALTFGFNWVLRLGAICYAVAWFTVMGLPRRGRARFPLQ